MMDWLRDQLHSPQKALQAYVYSALRCLASVGLEHDCSAASVARLELLLVAACR